MVLVLGIIFLIFLIFLFDWIISSEKEIFKEKIRTVIVIFSILLSILFLFFGLYYFSTFFVSLAIWFFKRKVFFDLIMRLFKKKNNSSIPLSEAVDFSDPIDQKHHDGRKIFLWHELFLHLFFLHPGKHQGIPCQWFQAE